MLKAIEANALSFSRVPSCRTQRRRQLWHREILIDTKPNGSVNSMAKGAKKNQLENHTSESIAPLFASPSLYKEKLRLNENVL
jgi:hypothetical protein